MKCSQKQVLGISGIDSAREKRVFEVEERARRRIRGLFWILAALIAALGIRLFMIQIVGAFEYEAASGRQHAGNLGGIGFRGTIFDRTGEALTNRTDQYIYLVEKTKINKACERLLKAAGAEKINLDSRRYEAYRAGEYRRIQAERLKEGYGAFVFSTTAPFQEKQPAAHLIGYVNRMDNSGAFGLQRTYDSLLRSEQELVLSVDALGRALPGYGVRKEGKEAEGELVTTLDLKVQQQVEKAFSEQGEKGSVCVVDLETGGILAGASFPAFDPNRVGDYLDSERDELRNRLLQNAYPPGSVFKIIVAAAAIEGGFGDLDTEFFCSGAEELYGVKIRCAKEEGHGRLSLKEAFAKSCNCAFIQLGKKIGSQRLLETAKAFGVGERVLDILEEETGGILPGKGDLSGAGIGNFSIGQGRLEMTCLQVARMTGIIACGGADPGIYLVEDKTGSKGKKTQDQVISPMTAYKVGQMMEETVQRGTGRSLEYLAAGKSGSAQSFAGGQDVVHGWFTGYFPLVDPKYAVTVFVEEGGGASPAVAIFNQIAGLLDAPKKETIDDY